MNKDDRKEIERIEALLSQAQEAVQMLAESLQERADNLGNAFQGGSPVLDALENQASTAEEIASTLEDMVGQLAGLREGE